jgi:hypothetical protein
LRAFMVTEAQIAHELPTSVVCELPFGRKHKRTELRGCFCLECRDDVTVEIEGDTDGAVP